MPGATEQGWPTSAEWYGSAGADQLAACTQMRFISRPEKRGLLFDRNIIQKNVCNLHAKFLSGMFVSKIENRVSVVLFSTGPNCWRTMGESRRMSLFYDVISALHCVCCIQNAAAISELSLLSQNTVASCNIFRNKKQIVRFRQNWNIIVCWRWL